MPRSRAEFCWTPANKTMLVKMVELGCSYRAIAVQVGRTPAACSAMYNLMKRNGLK